MLMVAVFGPAWREDVEERTKLLKRNATLYGSLNVREVIQRGVSGRETKGASTSTKMS
jgi:hypothetical protein